MNAEEYIGMIYSYVNTFLNKVTDRYKNETDPVGFCGENTFPVWVCWWQGEEQAPDVVKICLNSMRRNLPQSCARLHVITAQNFQEYISLPGYVIRKYNEGKISITHLSDIIRACLLCQYGGLWLDSTYFVGTPVPESLFLNTSFFTQKFDAPIWTDVVQGRWSINLVKGPAELVLFRYWRDALLFYWERHDRVLEYYLTDYIIAAAYNNLPAVKRVIDGCESNNPGVFALRELVNRTYDETVFHTLISDTQFFKLSYKVNYQTSTEDGRETFYGNMYRSYITI